MMRRHAAGHQIKIPVWIRQLFGGVLTRLNFEAAFSGRFCGAFQHRLSDVRQRDFVSEAREEQPCVSAARRYIQDSRLRRQVKLFDCDADILDVLQDVPAPVTMALFCELFLRRFLDFIQFHGFILRPPDRFAQHDRRCNTRDEILSWERTQCFVLHHKAVTKRRHLPWNCDSSFTRLPYHCNSRLADCFSMQIRSNINDQRIGIETKKPALPPPSSKFREVILGLGSKLLPHDTQHTTCPPAAVVSGEGPVIIISSIMRSGTHLLLDSLFNNFPTLRRVPLFIDFDAYERASLPLDPMSAVTGVIVKTHYPQTPLKPAYAAALAAMAGRSVVFTPTRPATQVRHSLAKWDMCMTSEEFGELERRFDGFWAPYSPNVVQFSSLLDRERVTELMQLVQQRTGMKPRSGQPVMPAHTRLGVYMDKALTRVLGCRVPRLNTTIGYRVAPKNLS
jgi:hypothetical protein